MTEPENEIISSDKSTLLCYPPSVPLLIFMDCLLIDFFRSGISPLISSVKLIDHIISNIHHMFLFNVLGFSALLISTLSSPRYF